MKKLMNKLFKKKKKLTARELKGVEEGQIITYLKSKGYTYTGWSKKKSTRRVAKITPIQAMRKKMAELKYLEGVTPKDYYTRNKWGIRWLMPEVRTEDEIKQGIPPYKHTDL